MMYMIKELLEQRNVATSWVNTWEYAMFRSAHQTTPAVLQAMLEKLKESCVEKGTWTLKDEFGNNVITLWNPSQGSKINVGIYLFHSGTTTRPEMAVIEDFNKDPEKRFKVNCTNMEMTEPAIELINWAVKSFK